MRVDVEMKIITNKEIKRVKVAELGNVYENNSFYWLGYTGQT